MLAVRVVPLHVLLYDRDAAIYLHPDRRLAGPWRPDVGRPQGERLMPAVGEDLDPNGVADAAGDRCEDPGCGEPERHTGGTGHASVRVAPEAGRYLFQGKRGERSWARCCFQQVTLGGL